MENFLVPFNFQVFNTTEAVWDFSKKETIKMFRMTRRGIGEFLTPESKRPEAVINKIIERNPHLRSMSIPVTVTVMEEYKRKDIDASQRRINVPTRSRQIQVETYDIWGLHQICVESALPRAKEFLRRFPTFMEALFTHRIMPPAIGDIRPEIIGYAGVPHKDKKTYRNHAIAALGWSENKFFRLCNKAEKVLGISLVNQRRKRADAGQVKNEYERQKALVYRSEYPQAHGKEIRAALNLRTSEANINRWLRAA